MTIFLSKQESEQLMKHTGYHVYRIVGWCVVWMATILIPMTIALDGMEYPGPWTTREVAASIYFGVMAMVITWAVAYVCYYLVLRLGIAVFLGRMRDSR